MTTYNSYRLIRWFFIVSLLIVIIKIGYDLLNHPLVVTTADGQGPLYLILLILALLVYGWFTLYRTRTATPHERIILQEGTRYGLLCGGAWIVELLLANVLGFQSSGLVNTFYYASVVIAFLLPGLAGLVAGRRMQSIGAGLQAALLCGMFGGLIIFLAATAFPILWPEWGPYDAQTINEFHRSGLSDITTYAVGDFLAGIIAHLWIGLISGLGPGTLGATFGNALARS